MTTARRVNVRGIIYKDGKLLAQQLKPGSDGIARDYWCTPGGGLNDNESLHDGLHREIIEETGIAPKIGKLLFIQQFHDGTKEQLEFFFHIENPEDYETIDLSKASHAELEIARVDFIDSKVTHVLPAFLCNINVEQYITSTLPVFVYTEG